MFNSLPSGLYMFKMLVRESYLYYNATSGIIWTQLNNLNNYLSQIGNIIVKLNDHVQTLIDTLT